MPTPMVQAKQECGGSVDGGNIPLLVDEAAIVPFYAYVSTHQNSCSVCVVQLRRNTVLFVSCRKVR